MKNSILVIVFFSIYILLSGCKKTNVGNSSSGIFVLTKADGTKFISNYVNVPIPVTNNTFSLQYSKPSGTYYTLYKFQFFILIDNNNNAYLDVWMPSLIKNGTSYTSNSAQNVTVDFLVKLNNSNLPISKSIVVFSSSTYPGHIIGSVKGYNSTGSLICSGEFDFTSQ